MVVLRILIQPGIISEWKIYIDTLTVMTDGVIEKFKEALCSALKFKLISYLNRITHVIQFEILMDKIIQRKYGN